MTKNVLIIAYHDTDPLTALARMWRGTVDVKSLHYTLLVFKKQVARNKITLDRSNVYEIARADVVLFFGDWRASKHTRYLHSLCLKIPALRVVYDVKDL